MTNRHKFLLLSAVTGAVLLLVPVNAWAQRGASGPPEHANVEPVNYRPNPYQVVRDWGHLPDERTWGSVSAVNVDIDGRHIWAGDRCGTNSCATTPNVDPIVSLTPTGTSFRRSVLVRFFGLMVWMLTMKEIFGLQMPESQMSVSY